MGGEKDNNRPDYIHEYLKPRKKYKNIALICIAIFVASVLIGVSAGLTVTISQRYLRVNEESQVEMIVIARDETVEETEELTAEEMESSEETGQESETEPESQSETSEVISGESSTYEESSEKEAEPEPLTGDELFREVYAQCKSGIVTVSYLNAASPEMFDTETYASGKLFGAAVQETDENIYVLADATHLGITPDTLFKVNDQPASLMGIDNLTNLMVLRCSKSVLPKVHVIPLGNSFTVQLLDRVYLMGSSMNQIGSADAGYLTYFDNRATTVDGYYQKLYTSMYRMPGSSAVLIDGNGRIVGWMSDVTSNDAGSMAVCYGISPLKYLIEDLCGGKDTAYLGVTGVTVTDRERELMNVPAGYYVQEIRENSPAYEAGVLPGDCIASIGGFTVSDSHSLQNALDELEPEAEVIIVIRRRDGEEYSEMNINATIGAR